MGWAGITHQDGSVGLFLWVSTATEEHTLVLLICFLTNTNASAEAIYRTPPHSQHVDQARPDNYFGYPAALAEHTQIEDKSRVEFASPHASFTVHTKRLSKEEPKLQ